MLHRADFLEGRGTRKPFVDLQYRSNEGEMKLQGYPDFQSRTQKQVDTQRKS